MTREEIVKSLRNGSCRIGCKGCAFPLAYGINELETAAADLIERQAKQNAALAKALNAKNAECDRITRERYEAVKHLEHYSACRDCVGYNNEPCQLAETLDFGSKCENWQWRGLRAGNGGDAEGGSIC